MQSAIIRRAAELAATDDEFKIAARYWTGALRIVVDREVHVLHMEDGRIGRLDLDQAEDVAFPAEVILAGPAEVWEQMLAPVPRPFYQDIAGAGRHGFALDGDPRRGAQYYPALQRFVALLRAAQEERP